MSKKNCWIDEFHIKVDWLRGLARNNQPFELPSGFPKFEDRQGFAKALGISKSDLANWCPDPKKKPKDPPPPANRPRVHFVRNVARVFGFAPPGGTDDDEVWRNWWAKRWRSFTPSETNRNETSPASVFEARYREALAKGTLVFLSPVLPKPITGPDPQPVTPPRPTFEQVREIAALIEQFKAELASDPRHDNKQGFILDQLDGIEIPPDPSIAIETYLLRLRIVQKALLETFHDAGSAPTTRQSVSANLFSWCARSRNCLADCKNRESRASMQLSSAMNSGRTSKPFGPQFATCLWLNCRSLLATPSKILRNISTWWPNVLIGASNSTTSAILLMTFVNIA